MTPAFRSVLVFLSASGWSVELFEGFDVFKAELRIPVGIGIFGGGYMRKLEQV